MKRTYKAILIGFFLIGINNPNFSQNLVDKLSRKLCKCIEKEQIKNVTEMRSCFEEIIFDNLKQIKEYYNAETIEEINMDELGNKIGAKLIKECNYVTETFPSGIVGNEEKVIKQANLKCDDLKSGDFYYLTERPDNGVVDTTFVTISNSMFLERMKNGRTYSLLELKWKDNCKFDLEFKESNDPMKKELSKPGDVYEYEILTNGNESFFLKSFWMEKSYQFELFKIK